MGHSKILSQKRKARAYVKYVFYGNDAEDKESSYNLELQKLREIFEVDTGETFPRILNKSLSQEFISNNINNYNIEVELHNKRVRQRR